MRLIAIKNLLNEAYRYPDAKKAIETWYLVTKNSDWASLEDVQHLDKLFDI
jgi:mRNA-degrading endonuclease HigB of HigAB toxin-antitoxin module